jgi:hypothetical protein
MRRAANVTRRTSIPHHRRPKRRLYGASTARLTGCDVARKGPLVYSIPHWTRGMGRWVNRINGVRLQINGVRLHWSTFESGLQGFV